VLHRLKPLSGARLLAVKFAGGVLAIGGGLALGALAGLLGVAFNRALVASLRLFGRASRWPRGLAGAIVGAGVGGLGWFVPGALGGGHALAERTLAGGVGMGALAGMFALRFALTMASYGTGAAGGIFAPLLVLGAQLGLMAGLAAGRLAPASAPEPTMFAVVGMAAAFAAIVRAPLTGIVLIVEMTSSYALMLPLLVACLVATAVADALGDRPIYEALLERDLLRGQDAPGPERTRLVEVTIAPGAPFDGRAIEDLGLPRGCLPLSVARGGRSLLPAPDLVLGPGDRLTAAVAAEAEPAGDLLRAGAGGTAG
jgi:CIC family chloride channel protein